MKELEIEKYKANVCSKRNKPFFKIAEKILTDPHLSWTTKAIVLCILHKNIPKRTFFGGNIILDSLRKYSNDKPGTIWNAMFELEQAGYGCLWDKHINFCDEPMDFCELNDPQIP